MPGISIFLYHYECRTGAFRALEGAVRNEDSLFWKHAKDWERIRRAKHAKYTGHARRARRTRYAKRASCRAILILIIHFLLIVHRGGSFNLGRGGSLSGKKRAASCASAAGTSGRFESDDTAGYGGRGGERSPWKCRPRSYGRRLSDHRASERTQERAADCVLPATRSCNGQGF